MVPNCAEAGVLGALTGLVGSIQATEALKLLLGIGGCAAQALKEELEIVDTKDDELLRRIISAASGWAERYTGRVFGLQVYQETVAGFGRRNLMLSRYPIRTVFRLFDSTSTSTATELNSSDYRIEDGESGLLSRDRGWGWDVVGAGQGPGGFGAGLNPRDPNASYGERKPWLVDYSAGYVPPAGKVSTDDGSTSTGRTLPHEVEQAVLLKAKEWFLRRKVDPGVSSRKIGDLSVSYRSIQEGPDLAEIFLMPYRRMG
jgi:hypothetical protein